MAGFGVGSHGFQLRKEKKWFLKLPGFSTLVCAYKFFLRNEMELQNDLCLGISLV